ncbi:MAG: hypothetical protein ACRDNW_20805 [Trebonia sp.]
MPTEFDGLNQSFFSLGQDDSHYAQLNALGMTYGTRSCGLSTTSRRIRM